MTTTYVLPGAKCFFFQTAPPLHLWDLPNRDWCERSRDVIALLHRDAKHQGPSSRLIAPVLYRETITNYREIATCIS